MWYKFLLFCSALILIIAVAYIGLKSTSPHDFVAKTKVEVAKTKAEVIKTKAEIESQIKSRVQSEFQDSYTLSTQAEKHILAGDATGGGHKCGAKKGKSEFSCSWDDEKIIRMIKRVANDNKAPLRTSGRYVARVGEEDGVQVRVLMSKEKHEIVTAYPLNAGKSRD